MYESSIVPQLMVISIFLILGWSIYKAMTTKTKTRNLVYAEILHQESRANAGSAMVRAGVGSVFLGPIGLIAGVSAKRKKTTTFLLHYDDGSQLVKEIKNNSKDYKKLTTKYLRTVTQGVSQ